MNNIEVKELIEGYIQNKSWRIRENSNTGYSISGLQGHISGKLLAEYALNEIYTKEISDAHKKNWLHIHDLSHSIIAYCFSGETQVKLLDGSIKSFEELSKLDEPFWVYSLDENNNIVPGLAHSARITRKDENIMNVMIDNGSIISCTPDHQFMLRDGTFKEAKNLKTGESLMPLYTRPLNNYEQVYNPRDDKYYYTHRLIMEHMIDELGKEVVHHDNGLKHDNRPENLVHMEDAHHRRMELYKTMGTDKWKDANKTRLTEYNKSEEKRKEISKFAKTRERTSGGTFKKNHKVLTTSFTDKYVDVYCMTVEKYHNFALADGVFVKNCAGWSIQDLLLKGFNGVEGKIAAKPAKHFDAILGQMVNFIGTLQNEWAGAQAYNSFDTWLAPFVKEDNLTYDQVKQGLQEFVFGLNQTSRWGNQVPFSNITLDWIVPNDMKDDKVIIGGKRLNYTFKECQKEMDMINKAFIEIMIEGDATGRIFTFPIPTYNITEDFNWESDNAKLLFQMTSKYGIPYFQNFIGSDLKPSDIRSMCCRLRLSLRELEKKVGGIFGAGSKTGSIGVVTLNLTKMAYVARNKEEFFAFVDYFIDIAKESLEIKRKVCIENMKIGLTPYSKYYLGGFRNHFSTIGIIGGHEACLNLLSKGIETEEGKELMKELLLFMRNKLVDVQQETKTMYNLEATPAEGASFRMANHLKKEFGEKIILSGTTDSPFLTNSTQLPVDFTDDLFKALDHQNELQPLYTGGCIEENSLVMTETGLLPIKKVKKGMNVYSFNEETYKTELKEVLESAYVDVKKEDKLTISLEGNNNITTSSWHPFYIIDRDLNISTKRADELEIGDFVVSVKNGIERYFPRNQDMWLSWLEGIFLTDGYIGKKEMSFYSKNKPTIDKIKEILDKMNISYKVYKNNEEVRIHRKDDKRRLQQLFKVKSGAKSFSCKLQKGFLHWSKFSRIGLLAGIIDGDGNVPKTGKYIRICSASEEFTKNLMELIYSLGMCSTYQKTNNLNYIFIRRAEYVKNIGMLKSMLTYESKRERLRETKTNGKHGLKCNEEIKKDSLYSFLTGKYKTKGRISFKLAELENQKLKGVGGFFVKNITKPEEKTKFCDLTVKDNNNYLAGNNGLVFIHNTVFHTFLGEKISDWRSTRNLVKKIAEKTNLPYFSITPTFSVCPEHGYIVGEHFTCPYEVQKSTEEIGK